MYFRSISSKAGTPGSGASTAHAQNSILILDAPGFQNPSTCGRYAGAQFEDLCHNYAQERLQLMFHERTISSLHERYLQVNAETGLTVLQKRGTGKPILKTT